MSLSWNEVRDRAIRFSRDWTAVTSERSEAKTFWDEFFDVFGLLRRIVASFEEPVLNLKGQYGYIDLFWRGVLLVEHKSFGQDLGKAESQAFRYIQDLARSGRTDEIPRYVILSDFAQKGDRAEFVRGDPATQKPIYRDPTTYLGNTSIHPIRVF